MSLLFVSHNPRVPYVGPWSQLVATPDGGICCTGVNDCAAVYASGKTFFVWINAPTGDLMASSYDHTSHVVSTPFTLHAGSTASDGIIHINAAIAVRSSDSKLLVVYPPTEYDAHLYLRVSSSALDATAWGAETPIATATATGFTFGYLMQLSNGDLYAFSRDLYSSISHIAYVKSTDGGSSWGSVVDLIQPRTTGGLYWRVGTDGTKIHIFTTDTDRASAAAAVYHFYLESDVLYKSDGTAVSGSAPYSADSGTLVQDTSLGSAAPYGWAIDSSGYPACGVICDDTTNSQSLYRIARWNGSSWSTHAIDSSGGWVSGNLRQTQMDLVKNDPDTVYYSKLAGGNFQIYKGTSTDSGATWSTARQTWDIGQDHLYPTTPLNAGSGLAVLWGRGNYLNDLSFNLAIDGSP